MSDLENTQVNIQVVTQGDAVCGSGYMLQRGENVAAFYIDGWGNTGRIYPVSTSSSIWDGVDQIDYPSIILEDGDDVTTFTEICFPEFEGWNVHAVSGGKTMSVCLTKSKWK